MYNVHDQRKSCLKFELKMEKNLNIKKLTFIFQNSLNIIEKKKCEPEKEGNWVRPKEKPVNFGEIENDSVGTNHKMTFYPNKLDFY